MLYVGCACDQSELSSVDLVQQLGIVGIHGLPSTYPALQLRQSNVPHNFATQLYRSVSM